MRKPVAWLSIVIILIILSVSFVYASTSSWDMSDSDYYTFDSGKIEFVGGKAQLKIVSDWYDSSWTKRKAITIDNTANSNELTNYQVQINVTYDDNMQTDFDDIRFTDENGTSLIDYWIETKTDSTSAIYWIEIPSISASSNKTIYMYYGNGSVSTLSSVANTFIRVIGDLEGAWDYDEGEGIYVYDNSGNSITGTLVNSPSWGTGKFGSGLSLDGSNQYILYNDPDELKFSGNKFTLSFWIKLRSIPSSGASRPFFSRLNWGISNAYYIGLMSSISYQLTLWVDDNCSGGGWYTDGFNMSTYVDDWTHVIATFDGPSSGWKRVYVNGNYAGGHSGSPTTVCQTGSKVTTGEFYPLTSGSFDGVIDHIQVFSDVLTTDETTDIKNNYPYATTNYPGYSLIRKYSSPEPSVSSTGSEMSYYSFDNPTVELKTANALTFTVLSGFVETAIKNNGEIKYQLSNNAGTTWYWYNSGWNTTTSGYSEANTAEEVNTNVSIFPRGSGSLTWKAYLNSDSTQLVQLDNLSVEYIYDTDSPSISLTALSPDPNSDSTPTLLGTATDTYSTIPSVEYRIGTTGTWTDCTATDGTFNSTSEAFRCTVSPALTDGVKTIYIRSTDSLDNTTASDSYTTDTFTIDTTAPTVSLTSISPDPTADTTPYIAGTAIDTSSILTSIEYQIDSQSGTWRSCTADDGEIDEKTESFTCQTTRVLGEGSHTIYVRSTDNLGHTSNPASDNFIVDTSAPVSLDNDYPADKSHIRLTRPTFRFKATTDVSSSVDHYRFEVDNKSKNKLIIDSIPPSGTSVISASYYTIDYSGFNDTNSDNNYIHIKLKSSKDWESDQNDGALKEGKHSWSITAYDSAGNSTTTTRIFYVDFTSPILGLTYLSSLGKVEGEEILTSTKPTFKGTLSDNILPDTITFSFYKRNYIFGIYTGQTLVLTKTKSLNLILDTAVDPATLASSFSFSLDTSLAYGKYTLIIEARDKAGNITQEKSYNIHILSPSKAKELLATLDDKDKQTLKDKLSKNPMVSIEDLAKKASVRRHEEADNLQVLFSKVKTTLSINNTTASIVNIIATSFANAVSTYQQSLNSIYTSADALLTSTITRLTSTATTIASLTDSIIPSSLKNFFSTLNTNAINTSRQVAHLTTPSFMQDQSSNSLTSSTVSLTDLSKTLKTSDEQVKQKIKQTHKGTTTNLTKTGNAFTTAVRIIGKPINTSTAFIERLTTATQSFISILFDSSPTKISNVVIEDITTDSVTVSFTTNHPTIGKVNYGEDLTYGQEVHLDKYKTKHTATLTNLKPAQRYYFEVMAQGKNYVYDAYYSVETRGE